ncbi:MAG: hypothetical protein FJZ96_10665 [Chloroflexi bacterium]|nr:hypothetical protein [Chloroflexota bacterium]
MNSKILGIIVLVVIFGGIAAATALGYWDTESSGGGYGGGSRPESGAESVRGRTTFQDLLDLGLEQEVIERIIGGDLPDPSGLVRVYCEENALDFEVIKEALQLELDNLASGE